MDNGYKYHLAKIRSLCDQIERESVEEKPGEFIDLAAQHLADAAERFVDERARIAVRAQVKREMAKWDNLIDAIRGIGGGK